MMPGAMPLALYRGDSAAWQFRLFEDENKTQPSDLTGVEAEAQIRDKSAGQKITNMACVVTMPNIIDVTLAAADSQAIAIQRGYWDLQLTYPDGTVHTIVAGGVTITGDITDSDPVAAPAPPAPVP